MKSSPLREQNDNCSHHHLLWMWLGVLLTILYILEFSGSFPEFKYTLVLMDTYFLCDTIWRALTGQLQWENFSHHLLDIIICIPIGYFRSVWESRSLAKLSSQIDNIQGTTLPFKFIKAVFKKHFRLQLLQTVKDLLWEKMMLRKLLFLGPPSVPTTRLGRAIRIILRPIKVLSTAASRLRLLNRICFSVNAISLVLQVLRIFVWLVDRIPWIRASANWMALKSH